MTKRRGSVFIVALVVIAVLTLLLATAAAMSRVDFQVQRNVIEGDRARRAAESGIARALASLQEVDVNRPSNTEEWWDLGQTGGESFTVDQANFRVQVLDAGAFININTAPEAVLQRLPMTQEQIDALLDWRTPGNEPRPGGAKDEYYRELEKPYLAKLGRLDLVSEMLLIRDFTPAVLYDPPTGESGVALTTNDDDAQKPLAELLTTDSQSPNTGADGTALQNINTAQAQALIQAGIPPQISNAIIARRNTTGTFATLGDVFNTPGMTVDAARIILDRFTTQGGTGAVIGKINLNTAREESLRSIPDLADTLIQAIQNQSGSFATLGELASLPGVTLPILSQIADRFTLGSSSFIVRVMGESGRRKVFLEAIVQIVDGDPKLIRVEESFRTNMMTAWGWPEEATQETELIVR